VKIEVSGRDEIGQLERKYNYMLMQIEELVEEKFRIGKESKNAELRALQAQINPHFLYNTLELITCMALKYKARDITDLVNLLARFYKLSLSKGKDIISIEDEIAHIAAYVKIQNLRFEDTITLEMDIDERLMEYSILKLVLQPLVENSILHGIMEREDRTGIIRITGRFEGGDIVLSVTDDGVGMSRDTLDRIFTENKRKDGHGFGVLNVDRRLRINYGELYGLSYKSVEGEGTTVEVKLPAVPFPN
jgi:two-component system sensor histidine kinase YesM